MSYDLFFTSRNPNSKPDTRAFANYFRQRKNYQVSDQRAVYYNATTGVCFVFHLASVGNEDHPDLLPAVFSLNYFRPHIFALEAEPEVMEFVKRFGLLVADPQIGGMEDGNYLSEAFLRGWNEGNEFEYKAMLKQGEKPPLTLPSARIESCWRWNSARDELQEKLGNNIFVPAFSYLNRNGGIVTTIFWSDGTPIAMPEADTILICRKEILPKIIKVSQDQVLVPWCEVEPIARQFPVAYGTLPYRLLNYPYRSVPAPVVSRLVQFRPTTERLEFVEIDSILNSELVDKVRGK